MAPGEGLSCGSWPTKHLPGALSNILAGVVEKSGELRGHLEPHCGDGAEEVRAVAALLA